MAAMMTRGKAMKSRHIWSGKSPVYHGPEIGRKSVDGPDNKKAARANIRLLIVTKHRTKL